MMEPEFGKPRLKKPLILAGIAVLIAAVGGWLLLRGHGEPMPKVPVSEPALAPVTAPAERIEHPVPTAQSDTPGEPLPELNDSDKALRAAMGTGPGGAAIVSFLVPESLVRHVVVTVDNLVRQKVTVDKRPVEPPADTFMANGDELHATLDVRNYQRYRPMVDALNNADMQRIAAVYLRFYPLFQKAYQDLGYPTGYFNDRLVKVIDVMLATPQISGPIELVRPNAMYQFADPALESRPAGQKILIRMGPDNAAVVKAKLMELRASITAAPPKR